MNNFQHSIYLSVALLTLASCVSSPPVLTSPQEKQSLHIAYQRCIAIYAEKLDDGISPANVIGNAIATNCSTEFLADAMTIVENDNDAVKHQFRLRAEQFRGEGPTAYVLSRRSALNKK